MKLNTGLYKILWAGILTETNESDHVFQYGEKYTKNHPEHQLSSAQEFEREHTKT